LVRKAGSNASANREKNENRERKDSKKGPKGAPLTAEGDLGEKATTETEGKREDITRTKGLLRSKRVMGASTAGALQRKEKRGGEKAAAPKEEEKREKMAEEPVNCHLRHGDKEYRSSKRLIEGKKRKTSKIS